VPLLKRIHPHLYAKDAMILELYFTQVLYASFIRMNLPTRQAARMVRARESGYNVGSPYRTNVAKGGE